MITVALGPILGLIVLAAAALIALGYVHQRAHGVVFRPWTMALFTAVSLVIFVLAETGSPNDYSAIAGIDWAIAAGAGAGVTAYAYARSRPGRLRDGTPAYRVPASVTALWLVLVVLYLIFQLARTGSVTFVGWVTVTGFPGWPPLTTLARELPDPRRIIDALLAASTGAVVGETVGISARLARPGRQAVAIVGIVAGRMHAGRPEPGRRDAQTDARSRGRAAAMRPP